MEEKQESKESLEIQEYEKHPKSRLIAEILLLRERLRLMIKYRDTMKSMWHDEMDKRINNSVKDVTE